MCFSGSVLKVVKAVLCFINDFSVGPEDWAPGLEGVFKWPTAAWETHILWTCPPIGTLDSVSNINSVWESMGS